MQRGTSGPEAPSAACPALTAVVPAEQLLLKQTRWRLCPRRSHELANGSGPHSFSATLSGEMRRLLIVLGTVALVAVVVIGLAQAGGGDEPQETARFDLEHAKRELAGAP